MRQRGRRSAAAEEAASTLTVIDGDFAGRARPDPPKELAEAGAAIWREVIRDEPAGFFTTTVTQGMLADYCTRRVSVEIVNAEIAKFKPEWMKEAEGLRRYHLLLRMRDMEMGAVTMLATKLRLTNQSRYHRHTAGSEAANRRDIEAQREL